MHDKSHYLSEILVATTWECNLHCSYCFVRQHGLSAKCKQMSPELAVRVVDSLDSGLTHVETICLHLYGGEPLDNLPALEAMVKRAGEKSPGRFRFAVTTNGVVADSSVYELLEKGRFQVILSIDGPETIHDECRRTTDGKPTHASVLRFLEGLRSKTHCWVRGSAVVRSGWSLMQAVTYLYNLPVDAVKAQIARVQTGTPYALNDFEKQNYLRELEEIGKLVISDLKAGRTPKDDRFSSRVLQLLKGEKRYSFCGAGYTIFGITPEGIVLPCVLINRNEIELGHIDDDPAIWLRKGEKWRESHRNRTECLSCSALPLCGGGCYAINSVCGDEECEIIRKNCEVATSIYQHFRSNPEALLALAGIV
ncbi:MAG: radical SAM protein [Nitrospirae bacterium]|nr:radical SAM protein [Nitrospirota bacterium]